MKLFRRRRKNNKGFSLVEVVCAVAILSLASTAIGSAMIMSTKSYQRGSAEVDVQKEAQTTTNLIGNLLVDAVAVDYQEVAGVSKTLKIDGEGVTYTLVYDEATDEISYTEQMNGGTPIPGVLAENVTHFDVDVANFTVDKNATVELTIEKNGKNYEATYSTTARNGASVSTGASELAMIICENEVTLEPNQNYTFPLTIYGISLSDSEINYSAVSEVGSDSEVGGTTLTNPTASGVTINVGNDAKGTLVFTISTREGTATPGVPLDQKNIVINVRRVNEISFVEKVTNDALKAGAVYRVYADAVGTNLNKKIGKAYDENYVNPLPMTLDVTMEGGTLSDYAQVIAKNEDSDRPYVDIELTADLPEGPKILVHATSKHAAGTNKTSVSYATVTDIHEICNTRDAVYLDSGIKRGNDNFALTTDLSFSSAGGNASGRVLHWYIRYRDKTANGEWTPYYATNENGDACKINAVETRLWLPHHAYEIEMILMSIDNSDPANPKLIFPTDSELLNPKYGFSVAGYGYPNLQAGWTTVDPNYDELEEYGGHMEIGAAEIFYKDSVTGVFSTPQIGNYNVAGLVVSQSSSNLHSIDFDTKNLERGHYGYTYKLYKYVAGDRSNIASWTDVTSQKSNIFNELGIGNQNITIKMDPNDKKTENNGSYMLEVYVTGEYKTIGMGTTLSGGTIYDAGTGTWPLCQTMGKGCIYFDVVD